MVPAPPGAAFLPPGPGSPAVSRVAADRRRMTDMDAPPDAAPPQIVTRAGAGRWGARLVVGFVVMVAGCAALLTEIAPPGIPTAVAVIGSLGGFGLLAASMMQITTRWRTSLRFDGEALVVRAPFAVAVHPLGANLVIGRWLHERRPRPEHWVIEDGRVATPIGDELDPVRIEAFAARLGVPVIDIPGDPPSVQHGA